MCIHVVEIDRQMSAYARETGVLTLKENHHVLVNQFNGNFRSKTFGCKGIKYLFRDVK